MLFQSLPQYMAQTTITFSTRLGETATKTIELTNPSKKTLTYTVRLEGSPEFKIASSMVKLEPRVRMSEIVTATAFAFARVLAGD